jgi:hypothetical protein
LLAETACRRKKSGASDRYTKHADPSREAYAQLTTPPMLKTLDWTRSRVRREHLISMGVPVNLDEVSLLSQSTALHHGGPSDVADSRSTRIDYLHSLLSASPPKLPNLALRQLNARRAIHIVMARRKARAERQRQSHKACPGQLHRMMMTGNKGKSTGWSQSHCSIRQRRKICVE